MTHSTSRTMHSPVLPIGKIFWGSGLLQEYYNCLIFSQLIRSTIEIKFNVKAEILLIRLGME